jgi:hypothetical protein
MMIVASQDIQSGDLICIDMPDGGQDLMSVDCVHWHAERLEFQGFLLYGGESTSAFSPFNMRVEVWAHA